MLLFGIVPGVIAGRISYISRRKKAAKKTAEQIVTYRKTRQAKEPDLLKKVAAAETVFRRYEQQVQACAQRCGLHRSYQNYHAVIYLTNYLETGRCDTLKEALNLYEQERREDMRDEAESRYRLQMNKKADAIYNEAARGADAAQEAARSAEDAAFWGAAATVASLSQKHSTSDNGRIV